VQSSPQALAPRRAAHAHGAEVGASHRREAGMGAHRAEELRRLYGVLREV
jgi:hypothetical protein